MNAIALDFSDLTFAFAVSDKSITESTTLDKVVKYSIVAACTTTCAYAAYIYLPVAAFEIGFHGSLLVSSIMVPHPASFTYYSAILPAAVHSGMYCYSSPVAATAIEAVSSASGVLLGNAVTALYEYIKKLVSTPGAMKKLISKICTAFSEAKSFVASLTGIRIVLYWK
jgi:hypothetical protein